MNIYKRHHIRGLAQVHSLAQTHTHIETRVGFVCCTYVHTLLESKEELVSDVLMGTRNHGIITVRRSRKMYIRQLVEDVGCEVEDVKTLMKDREERRKLVRLFRAFN